MIIDGELASFLLQDIEKKIKDGKKKQTLTDEEVWELEDKLNELKESLKGKEWVELSSWLEKSGLSAWGSGEATSHNSERKNGQGTVVASNSVFFVVV